MNIDVRDTHIAWLGYHIPIDLGVLPAGQALDFRQELQDAADSYEPEDGLDADSIATEAAMGANRKDANAVRAFVESHAASDAATILAALVDLALEIEIGAA